MTNTLRVENGIIYGESKLWYDSKVWYEEDGNEVIVTKVKILEVTRQVQINGRWKDLITDIAVTASLKEEIKEDIDETIYSFLPEAPDQDPDLYE